MRRLTFRIVLFAILVSLVLASGKRQALATPVADDTAGYTFPELTGPYKVGRVAFEWIDQSRDEIYASAAGLKRDLMVNIWFPAEPAKRAKIAAYMGDSATWSIVTNHPELDGAIHSHAYGTKAIASQESSYPVIILEPDNNVVSFYYSSLVEELASHGYIVVGMSHPFNTTVVSYPDGRLVRSGFAQNALAPAGPTNSASASQDILHVWTQDVQFVLDQLAAMNASDKDFKGRLDLNRVGIMGHAFGGTAAVKTASVEPRIKAGVSMEGLQSKDVPGKPFMWMGIGGTPTTSQQQAKDTYWMTSNKMTFLNYGDFALLPPAVSIVAFVNSGGPIDPARANRIDNDYLLTFFNHYLNGAELKWPTFDETQLVIFPIAK